DDVRIYDRVLSEEEMREITGLSGVKAAEPNPSDGRQLDTVAGVVLSWKPGAEAVRHDVYFGASLDDVTTAATTTDPGGVYKGRQDLNQYAVGMPLDFGKTYYWRIDEVGGPPSSTIYKGDVWRFTAEPLAYVIPGSVITATATSSLSSGTGPQKTIDGSGLDDNDLHSTNMEDMWLSGSMGPQPTWIEYQFDKVYKLHEMWVWNQNQLVESSIGYGFKDVTIEYSVDGADYKTLGTTHQFAQSPGTPDCAHNTTVDLGGVTAKYVRLTANSNWGGWLKQYGLSEVRFFRIPVRAREPNPPDGAAGEGPDLVLGWRAGREAATHDVYLGSDREAVLSGVAYVGAVTEARYDAGALDLGQTYFWRVNEIDAAQSSALQGELWSFTTPDYLIVDNFEDYNDYSPSEVWATWTDGYGTADNGSTVGYPNPNWYAGEHYVETTIVHGGNQSMPLFYDNSFKYSQVERAMSPAQDWTRNGIQALSLNFYGDPNNAVEQMYVKINGSRVVYDGDPAAITKGAWTRWNIDLASSGANLANVTKLAIGFGDQANLRAGGSGMVFFDDIRLYRLAPEPPVERWFEAEAADSITAPMQTYNDPRASGGRYIGTDGGSGDETEDAPVYGVATYNFTVPEGTYKVLLHVIVIGGADSFWVRIPDAACAPGTYRNTGWIKFNVIDKGDNWHWDEVHSNSHGNEVVKFTLSPGTHTLEIARRDAGTFLDCILITDELDLNQKSLPHVIP
ncbi:MAG TPA: discoidin domain-containing protein, partial [Sedimentisphaerales bacterium]|nr:discoidin domain-containing protein [Sedimentisphaerales bacterium]